MMRRVGIILGLMAALICVEARAQDQHQDQRVVPASRADLAYSYAPVVKKVTPAVVNVYASRTVRGARNPLFDDPIFQQFFGGGPSDRTAQSLGSGVIVDGTGLVVTNNHVIENMTDVKIALSDRREFEADIVLTDPRTDLAVLRIRGSSTYPVLELGDSDALEVGDLVLAIGNPFGVGQTVTQGIVSALARTQIGASDYGFFIQTDAAINPGNSGGALVDLHGRLIGINSAIYSKSGGSMGIGFAIPVNMVRTVIAAAKAGTKDIKRAWIGARLQAVTRDIAEHMNLARPVGALVADVTAKGPADQAGIRRGDVILSVERLGVDDPEAFGYRIATRPLGTIVNVTLSRAGQTLTVPLTLESAPEIPRRESVVIDGRSPFTGATIVNLSPATQDELSIDDYKSGVAIADVKDDSIAASWLRKGDVILTLNGMRIQRTTDLKELASAHQPYWKISISRNGDVLTSVFR
jgi:Do/DeqQ family serine protease